MRVGWVKLHRKLIDHPRFSDGDWLKVWTTCLLLASHRPLKRVFGGQEITLAPGQFITSQNSLFNTTKVQRSKIERILRQLKTDNQIDKQGGNKSRLITVLNWGEYQGIDKTTDKQPTNKRQTSDNKQELEEGKEEELRRQFEAFWSVYPGRKRGTDFELTHFKTKYPDRWTAILPHLLPAAVAYVAQCESEVTELRYRLHLKTWINTQGWTTEQPKTPGAPAALPLPEDDYVLDSLLETTDE